MEREGGLSSEEGRVEKGIGRIRPFEALLIKRLVAALFGWPTGQMGNQGLEGREGGSLSSLREGRLPLRG